MKKMMKLLCLTACIALLCCAFVGCGAPEDDSANIKDNDKAYGYQLDAPAKGEQIAILHTSKGDIYLRLFAEEAPKAVENFVTHAKNGYYDNLTFHRVIDDFMIQGGDPKGDGTGGESIWGNAFEDEFHKKLFNLRGAVAMANNRENANGSQFFINQAGPTGDTVERLKAAVQASNEQVKAQAPAAYQQYVQVYGPSFTSVYPTEQDFLNANLIPAADLVSDEAWELYAKYGGNIHLDGAHRYAGGHTVFGQVFDGMDVVDAIAKVDTDSNDKPTTAVTIKTIEITTWEG